MESKWPALQKMLGCKKSRIWITMRFFKKFKCNICSSKFSKPEELMQHQQVVHFKDLPYDCKECNKNFSNMEDMRTHLQREHSYKKDR